jgi:serine/threonine-protein kinase
LLCAATGATGDSVRARLRELQSGVDPAWAAAVEPPEPLELPGYTIVRPVAHGALTTVYEATHRHPNLAGRRVALKVLKHREYADQFLGACRVSAGLRHRHIPALCEVAEDRTGRLYSVRDFVDGQDLQQDIGCATHPPDEVVRIVTAVADAIDYAHYRGIVHCHIHPRHLLRGHDGSPWLIGFGEVPQALPIPGNPVHLAPEQFEGLAAVGPHTDVYLLAETAVWLLAGRHPFAPVVGIEALLTAKRSFDPWAADRGIRALLPAGAEPVVRRAMTPNPAHRYPTAGQFAEALARAIQVGGRPRRWWQFW